MAQIHSYGYVHTKHKIIDTCLILSSLPSPALSSTSSSPLTSPLLPSPPLPSPAVHYERCRAVIVDWPHVLSDEAMDGDRVLRNTVVRPGCVEEVLHH